MTDLTRQRFTPQGADDPTQIPAADRPGPVFVVAALVIGIATVIALASIVLWFAALDVVAFRTLLG